MLKNYQKNPDLSAREISEILKSMCYSMLVQTLLANGADPKSKDRSGKTPIALDLDRTYARTELCQVCRCVIRHREHGKILVV